MKHGNYKLIDHTADLGIEVFATDLKQLFVTAAMALSDTLTDVSRVNKVIKKEISVSGDDLEQLMINWLHEIIYHFEVNYVIFNKFEIESICSTSDIGVTPTPYCFTLNAVGYGEIFDHEKHVILTEVKAVTHHQLTVKEVGGEWFSRIIFDL